MKHLLLFIVAPLFAVLQSFAYATPGGPIQHHGEDLPPFVPDQVLVGFVPGTPAAERLAVHRQVGGRVLRTLDAIGVDVAAVAHDTVLERAAVYQRNPNVRFAEPNYLRPVIIPNEGTEPWPYQPGATLDFFSEQWGLHNTGQAFYYDENTGALGALKGTPGADIDAPAGWDISTGHPDVVIAVLDTGVDCNHPDLFGKCVEQTNFGPSTYGTTDLFGHGTHVAGIAAAHTNNDHGIAGVGWDSSIAALKVCYEYEYFFSIIGVCDTAASAEAMIHAADQGYDVVNMSYAGPDASSTEKAAVEYAWANGVVLVAAAANAYSVDPVYPAAFPEVIAVAATDHYDNLASFSNFGSDWVSVAAPGHRIISTVSEAYCGHPDCYAWFSGTSMATPMVSGVAALAWEHLGFGATNADVRAAIENGADRDGALGQNFRAWTAHGRVNVRGALSQTSTPVHPAEAMHVGDLDGTATRSRQARWEVEVTILVHDSAEQPVSGAGVSGDWSGAASANASCTTNGSGTCTVSKSNLKQNSPSVTFTVTGLSRSGYVYDPSANHDPDDDSDGTSITVVAP